MNKEKNINNYMKYGSAISFSTGLIYGLFLLAKNIFCVYEIKETEVQILAALLAAGLLGSVFDFVLRKILTEFLEHYKEELTQKIKYEWEQTQTLTKEENDVNTIEETKTQPDNSLNTVIVPVQNSLASIKRDLIYVCPAIYKFKDGLEYIAFYKNKEIVGYGRLRFPNNYNKDVDGKKIFEIENYIEREIPHNKKGAFIQNKKYCKIDELLAAKTTDDIR